MNRSIIAHYDQLDEGIISKVGGHLKRNWGKYALGGAALATGGALLTNPALASRAASAVGSTAQSGLNAVGGAAQKAGNYLGGGFKTAGDAVSGGLSKAAPVVNKAVKTTGTAVQNLAQKGQNLINPGNAFNKWDKSVAQPALKAQASRATAVGMNRFNKMYPVPK